MKLELLTVRDELTFDEAIETLRTQHSVMEPRERLEAWAATFPDRQKRRHVSDDGLSNYPAIDSRPDAPARQAEAASSAIEIRRTLATALRALEPQDRLILRLHCAGDRTIADIARELRLEQKPLYARIDGLCARLRKELERAGITYADALEVLDQQGFDVLSVRDEATPETAPGVRLSKRGGDSPAKKERAE